MKKYFITLFQDIKEDLFPGKENREITAELIAHAINAAIILDILHVGYQEFLLFFNN